MLTCAAWLAARPDELVRSADKYMRAQAISTLFSGTVLVARGGRVLFAGGYGYADIDRAIRNDRQTRFRIGSITKPFTAMTVLQLQESGLLDVAEQIFVYLEPCPSAWSPLTIHHLLSHTSGIPDLTAREDYLEATAKPATRDEVLATFRDLPLRFRPGDKFEYSNSNYHLLGVIVERVTGQRFIDVLEQRTLAPLGLAATFIEPSSPTAAHVAVGYRPADDGSLHPDSPLDPSWSFTSGALFSTVDDLYRWSRALDDGTLLSAASRELMWTPVQDTYGYGWTMRGPERETLNRRIRMHSGRTQGYTACFVRFLDDDLTAIVLSNNVMGDTCGIVRGLAAIVLGEPYEVPIARRAVRLDPAILERYAGRYRYTDDVAISITRQGDLLVAQLGRGTDRYQLFAETETEFFLKTFDAQAEFLVNRAGTATGLAITFNGQHVVLPRLLDSDE